MLLPRLYVIADLETLARLGVSFEAFALEIAMAGVELVQLRDKRSAAAEVLAIAAAARTLLPWAKLIMNDSAELALACSFSGVHVGQGDLSVAGAYRVLGAGAWVGLSTHTDEQVRQGDQSAASYLAIGPVFGTRTKLDASPVVGLDGVRRARALTAKPLVAIGGITRENCRSVIEAGADSVAVISGLFVPGETVEEVARDFLRILR